MQIALWSNDCDNVGATTFSSVLATYIAASYNYKTLLTHSLTKSLSMEDYLTKTGDKGQNAFVDKSNIDDVFRLINNGKLTNNLVKNYCYSLLSHSNLDFLNSTKTYEPTESFCNNYMYLLYLAKQYYDVCVIDLNVSKEHPLFERVLKETDIFIVVGRQNQYGLRTLLTTMQQEKERLYGFNLKNLLVLNQYDHHSSIALKQLIKEFPIKKPYILPYQTEIIDACNRHELVDYILRQLYNKRRTSFSDYLKCVGSIAEEVMKQFQEVEDNAI